MWIMIKDQIIEQLVICDNLASKSLSNSKRKNYSSTYLHSKLNDPKTLQSRCIYISITKTCELKRQFL
jgi:hypothetical protein